MATWGTAAWNDVAIKTLMVKDLMSEILPRKVIDRITSVSEEYMVNRMTTAIKVQFNKGVWSPPLYLRDTLSTRMQGYEGLKKRAENLDEFVTHCLMIYEAGDGLDT